MPSLHAQVPGAQGAGSLERRGSIEGAAAMALGAPIGFGCAAGAVFRS
jgi:hypothetical protein